MAHVDTVPLCRGARPVRRGRWIVPADKQTALGADDRAGAAVILFAAMEILRRGLPHPPLTFLWTVQEEIGLYGARYGSLGPLAKPALAFNFDGGTIDKVTVGATGGYHVNIHVTGRASHAGVAPEEGINAITIAALAIARLHRGRWLGQIRKGAGQGTSNIGVIRGGEATNVVTPAADLRAEARSHDPAFRRQIVRAIERAFHEAAGEVRSSLGGGGKVRFEGRLDYESFRLSDDDPSVLEAEAAICALGRHPVRVVSNGGLDANWMSARGIPTVTLGCGQSGRTPPPSDWTSTSFSKAAGLRCGWPAAHESPLPTNLRSVPGEGQGEGSLRRRFLRPGGQGEDDFIFLPSTILTGAQLERKPVGAGPAGVEELLQIDHQTIDALRRQHRAPVWFAVSGRLVLRGNCVQDIFARVYIGCSPESSFSPVSSGCCGQ